MGIRDSAARNGNFTCVCGKIVLFHFQVRITDALLSSLDFKRGKDAEIAWLNARITNKGKKRKAKIEEPKNNESEGNSEPEKFIHLILFGPFQ